MKYVKVPDDRLVLLRNGTKEKVEEATGTEILIDKEAKTVSIEDDSSVKELDCKRVIEAISVGFKPHEAFQLIDSPVTRLEKINIRNQTRNNKEFSRQKGRIIGENGRTRELISEFTSTTVRIHNDRVGIVGENRDAQRARRAIMSLIRGKPHPKVYKNLEQYRKNKVRSFATRF